MDKNREAFRNRFLAYKNGKSVREIYGIPEYQSGKVNYSKWDTANTLSYIIPFIKEKAITLTDAGRATGAKLSTNLLDSLADNAVRAGVPVRTAIGLATKESTLGNPTDDRTAWNLSSAIRELFDGLYPGTAQHINNGTNIVQGDNLINYHKGNINTSIFSDNTEKSVLQEGLEFYKQHPDKYNPGQPGYQKAVKARGNEVMKSPEVLKWYKEWEAKQVKVMRPKPYLLPTIQSTAPKKFGKYSDGKLPKFATGTEGEPNYSDDVYKNMYYENAALPDYLKFVNEGVPEKIALDWVKRQVREYPSLYALKGPTLPEVVVKPNPNSMSTGRLVTYYPWSTDFPVTGHSTLELLHDDDNSSAFVTAYGDDPWYNFVTDNCSDATRKAIEYSTGKKINPLFFTTPGDVKDFVESELGGKSKYIGDGSVETTFSIPTKQARKIVEYSRMLNKKRFVPKHNKYAE